jgi:hypothetical protein
MQAARRDLGLATELAQCAQLIKGYGDTHARFAETRITPAAVIAAQ